MLNLGVLLLACAGANAALVERWVNITYVEGVDAGGLFTRRAIGINGTWPPPPLHVSQNDTLRVHAFNGLDKTTALHHHGMYFPNMTYMDGVPGITQCGIPPGASYTYDIPLVTQEPGTYWYHAHDRGEYVDGLRAPFVIHAAQEAHSYDEEFTVILGDWYSQEHPVLLKKFLNKFNPTGAEPVPEAALMYFAQNETYLTKSDGKVAYNDDASINFVPGRTYRLRILNTAAFSMFSFYIDGHDMRVIEVDGVDTQEFTTSTLTLTAAQRYSVLITARNDTSQNFKIHADFNPDMFDSFPDTQIFNWTSSIIYDPASPYPEPAILDTYDDFNDLDLVPMLVQPSELADVSFPLVVTFDTYTDGTNRGTFNNTVLNFQRVPAMYTALTMGQDAMNPDVYGPGHFILEYGQMVEIVIYNTDPGKHPFHLHGHKFQLIHKSYNTSSDDPAINPPLVEGQANPARRDTVQVPPEGSATIRFRADNPGAWLFHCHIEWHLESGLGVTFMEAPLQMQQHTVVPSYVADQCLALGQGISGNAVGRNSVTELGGLKVGPWPQSLGWHTKGILAMVGCIVTALLGMFTVVWYAFMGPDVSEEEHEREVAEAEQKKAERKKKLGGLLSSGSK